MTEKYTPTNDPMVNDKDLETPEEKKRREGERYSHLIVFGFGAKPRTKEEADEDPDGKHDMGWYLTAGIKARVLAAGELWNMREVDKIIMSEEKGPDKEKSGGELMKEYLLAKYPEIPEDKVVVEDKASNTIENFAGTIDSFDDEELNEGANDENSGKNNLAFLSNGFHMSRIQEIAKKFGLSWTRIFL